MVHSAFVAEQTSVGIGVVLGQRGFPILAVALDTELFCFFFTLYLMKFLMNLV